MTAKRPVLFLAHGAPPLLDDAAWKSELLAWAESIEKPRAILVFSAHWDETPLAIGATSWVPLVYDFYGFPARYYQVQYPAPGAPELAARLQTLLAAAGEPHRVDPMRGLDHGVYIPLLSMFPRADVPVLQVSLPGLFPRRLFELGRALAPLRDEGVLIIGSGFLTHNMRVGFAPTASWAREFDDWAEAALARRDWDALIDFQERAPAAKLAHPTWEHYAPLLVSAGAVADGEVSVKFPVTGFWMGSSFSKRSVELA